MHIILDKFEFQPELKLPMSPWNYDGSQVSDRCPLGYLLKRVPTIYVFIERQANSCLNHWELHLNDLGFEYMRQYIKLSDSFGPGRILLDPNYIVCLLNNEMTSCKILLNVQCIFGPANGIVGIVHTVPVVPINNRP